MKMRARLGASIGAELPRLQPSPLFQQAPALDRWIENEPVKSSTSHCFLLRRDIPSLSCPKTQR